MVPEDELRRMYLNERMSIRDIANVVGVSSNAISRWMKTYEIASRTLSESHMDNIIKPSKEKLRYMYCDEKMTQKEIGDLVGVERSTVYNWMKRYGIKSRTVSESLLGNLAKPSKEELQCMYNVDKLTSYKIANNLGIGQSTVSRWMEEYGIESCMLSYYTGEKASGWCGGISFEPYCFKFNNKFKEAVRERDDYICQLCRFEQKPNGRKLSVHHIHYDKENCYPDVVALCCSCNSKVNSDRDYWEEYFENQLIERGLYCWSIQAE